MYVTNLDEVVSLLRSKLDDYLVLKGIKDQGTLRFRCFVHADNNPSMHLNPKTNLETAHCFACGATVDIFSAAHRLEGLPTEGKDWVNETIPALAEQLQIPVSLGEPSVQDIQRARYLAMAADIADVLSHPANTATAYMQSRNWENTTEDCYSMDFGQLLATLEQERGWDPEEIRKARMVSLRTEDGRDFPFVGEDKATFIVRDHRGRPVAFISRAIDPGAKWKYLHSAESPIYNKREVLYGLDTALAEAKRSGLIIVEGPADRMSLLRCGISNVAAVCGVALTEDHLNHLKALGIRTLYLMLDWDDAGQNAIESLLVDTLRSKRISGFEVFVGSKVDGFKDIDEYLNKRSISGRKDLPAFLEAFDWLIGRTDVKDLDEVSRKLIPVIAACPTAIKRDQLASKLSAITGVSQASILIDAERIRNRAFEERQQRILASVERYRSSVEKDPTNINASIANHEKEVEEIDAEYNRDTLGVNYQLSRFDALQQVKGDINAERHSFNMGTYTFFKKAMAGGAPWTEGAYLVFGGRPNAAKSAVVSALMMDILINDPNAIAILHLTDDSYRYVEGRLITNTAYVLTGQQKLTVGEASCPGLGFSSAEASALYNKAVTHVRGLIAEERLIIMDGEDGSTLSALEKQVKYVRRRYPHKKLLVVCDGLHNYTDFPHLEATPRIARITDMQKRLAVKYQCCVVTTAEYRKNSSQDSSKLKYPVDDDLADSRAITFRATVIIHVYNDVNDRRENAEIFWVNPFEPDIMQPRLVLLFGKNKHSKFKEKLIMDLDRETVTIRQRDLREATAEADALLNKTAQVQDGHIIMETDYQEGE